MLNALNKLDIAKEHMSALIKKAKFIKLIPNNSELFLYDANKKQILSANYDTIGIYAKAYDVWIWGWAIANDVVLPTSKVRKLLMYALDKPVNAPIKFEFITSRYRIYDPYVLDIMLGLALHIGNEKYLLKVDEFKFKLPYSSGKLWEFDEKHSFSQIDRYLFMSNVKYTP